MAWRWQPPPGWPRPPAGWAPPPGWEPDPAWPPAPVDWQWWQPAPRRWWLAPLIHGVAVLALFAGSLGLEATTPADAGADIGGGIVGLALLGLGLPWTVPWAVDPDAYDRLSNSAHYEWMLGGALLNVAIHAIAFWLRARARRSHRRL